MRKFTLIVLQMLCVAFVAQAQSFKLYVKLDDIEKDGSGLNWREAEFVLTGLLPERKYVSSALTA